MYICVNVYIYIYNIYIYIYNISVYIYLYIHFVQMSDPSVILGSQQALGSFIQ